MIVHMSAASGLVSSGLGGFLGWVLWCSELSTVGDATISSAPPCLFCGLLPMHKPPIICVVAVTIAWIIQRVWLVLSVLLPFDPWDPSFDIFAASCSFFGFSRGAAVLIASSTPLSFV